jgi:hypothetical protein
VPSQDRDMNRLPLGRIVGQMVVVNAPNGLRMRDAPINGATVTTIPNGSVIGHGPSTTPGWGYAEYNGFYGYVSNDYLDENPSDDFVPEPPEPPPAPVPPPPAPVPTPPLPAPTPKSNTNTILAVAGAAAGAALLVYLAKRYRDAHAF